MQIPESIRARITKLLALAQDSRGNEHETAMASAKVQALLAESNLEMSQVVGNDDSDPDAERDRADDAIETFGDWQTALLSQIAENNLCLHLSSLVLSDAYSSEDDLNRDLYRGVPAGTTARERAANEARWAEERVARASAPAPEPIHETDA